MANVQEICFRGAKRARRHRKSRLPPAKADQLGWRKYTPRLGKTASPALHVVAPSKPSKVHVMAKPAKPAPPSPNRAATAKLA